MDWIRRNPKSAAGLAALMMLLLAVLVWGLRGSDPERSRESRLAPPIPSSTPRTLPSITPTPVPSPSTTPEFAPGDGTFASQPALNGLPGGSQSESIPKHRAVLTLTSEHKLPFLIYNIPTSREHRAGKSTELGTSWRLETTVYGKPDYAQLFTRAGPEGYPITCTIRIDGRITARLTSEGPYGKIFCQG